MDTVTLHPARESIPSSAHRHVILVVAVEVLVDNHLLAAVVSPVVELILRLLPQRGGELV